MKSFINKTTKKELIFQKEKLTGKCLIKIIQKLFLMCYMLK